MMNKKSQSNLGKGHVAGTIFSFYLTLYHPISQNICPFLLGSQTPCNHPIQHPKKASQLPQPFFQNTWSLPMDRQTDRKTMEINLYQQAVKLEQCSLIIPETLAANRSCYIPGLWKKSAAVTAPVQRQLNFADCIEQPPRLQHAAQWQRQYSLGYCNCMMYYPEDLDVD